LAAFFPLKSAQPGHLESHLRVHKKERLYFEVQKTIKKNNELQGTMNESLIWVENYFDSN